LTPAGRDGKVDAGASAIITDPVIAVVEVPLLPEIVPMSGITYLSYNYVRLFNIVS
jgi:hypothetical protein